MKKNKSIKSIKDIVKALYVWDIIVPRFFYDTWYWITCSQVARATEGLIPKKHLIRCFNAQPFPWAVVEVVYHLTMMLDK